MTVMILQHRPFPVCCVIEYLLTQAKSLLSDSINPEFGTVLNLPILMTENLDAYISTNVMDLFVVDDADPGE